MHNKSFPGSFLTQSKDEFQPGKRTNNELNNQKIIQQVNRADPMFKVRFQHMLTFRLYNYRSINKKEFLVDCLHCQSTQLT